MTLTPFKGRCHTCGHDHDADDSRLRDVLDICDRARAENAPQGAQLAGVAISLRIGQHVRHRDYKGQRVTGVVKGLALDSEGTLQAEIVLDAPIVITAGEGRPIDLWRQCVPAHELSAFDARDELIAELRGALQAMLDYHDDVAKAADQRLLDAGYAALAKSGAPR